MRHVEAVRGGRGRQKGKNFHVRKNLLHCHLYGIRMGSLK